MSISLNPASTVPVESHPLSPDDLPGTGSGGGRTGRRRTTTKSRDEQHGVRPVTSYFALHQESEDSNGYAHHTYHSKRTPADWDGSVRTKRKRHAQEPSTRASTLSQVWERPSVPFFIVGSSERALSTPPGTPIQRPIFSLGGKNQTLHDLPARAASHVLTTPFHALNDSDIQSAVSDVSVLADEDNASVKHPYHSALRVLSEAVDKLGRARIELEQGRRRLLEKQTRIRELIKDSGDPLRESLLAILDEARSDFESESDDDDGRLSLKDSLSVALSEDLTPTYPDPPSSVISHAPPEPDPPDGDQLTDTPLAPSLVVSSESRSLLFTPSTDDLVPDHPVEGHGVPRTPSPVRTPLPLRTKSRANSSASLASMSSTASKGLGDWMGWFGKARTPQPSKLDSAVTEDTASVNEDAIETQATEEKTPGPGAGTRAEVKPTPTMRLANGILNTLRMGSTTPQSSPPSAPASSHKRNHKRKISLNITVKSIPSSAVGSPVLGAFTLPPPLPAPPLAVTARAIPEQQHPDDLEPTTEPEAASVLSSAKEKDSPMQGATLRALSNATRVMTTDPASILVDHGQDVGELVTRLAWELVRGVRDEGITFREPVKPKAKDEAKRSKAGAVKKLAIVGGGSSSAVDKARRASTLGALASPLLGGFGAGTSKAKSPPMSAREEGAPGNSAVAASVPTGAPLSTAPTAGALSVPLESIIPAIAKPPTQYLARTYTSLISPDFRPPSSFGGFTSDRFATREGAEPITDRFGFVYEVSSYDVLLLDRALRAGNSAPGCLTGIKVADREENDDWSADEDADREFEVVRGSCACVEGVRLGEEAAAGELDVVNGNGASEAASMVSTSSSKRSGTRGKAARTLSLSAPLKVASLDYLPATTEAALVPSHACPNTVRALVALITEVHDAMQARRKAQWDAFLRVRRDMKPVKASGRTTGSSVASGGAAVMLGLGAHGAEDDVEELRQSEGLVGFAQMGLAANQGERREFGRLVRVGIPLVYRAKVWLECSGALEMAEPGAFRDLLEDAVREGGVAIGEIEKDVGRTMPLNVFFGGDGVGVDKLRRVLRAYSRRNPGVGYCQGMNLVASTLLLVHADEEDAFWNLACIIEKHLPEDFFSPSLLVSRACPLVLLDYVHDLLPALFDHLTHLGVDLPAICFSWFLSLFTDCLPVETLFRVWDVFIVDGLDVLFRTALAILRINEAELLQAMSVPALYVALESLPTRMWEVDKLLKHEADLRPYVVNADIIKKRDARVKELKDLAT